MQSNLQAAKEVLSIKLGRDWQAKEDAILEPLGFTSDELLDACFRTRECVFIGSSPSLVTSAGGGAHVAMRVTDAVTVLSSGVRFETSRCASLGDKTHRDFGALSIACELIETLIGDTPMTRLMKEIA